MFKENTTRTRKYKGFNMKLNQRKTKLKKILYYGFFILISLKFLLYSFGTLSKSVKIDTSKKINSSNKRSSSVQESSLSNSLTLEGQNKAIQDGLFSIYTDATAEKVWSSLLLEAKALISVHTQKLIAFEVGMHRIKQCVEAAEAGLTVHCIEPSPQNFARVKGEFEKNTEVSLKDRIYLHNKAAGANSGNIVNFTASGGTGDHVGEFDVWNMKIGKSTDPKLAAKKGVTVQVPSIKLDDIIESSIANDNRDRVFILKIDTQGYEPAVFAGLENYIFTQHKVEFVLFEYWPKGMDLLSSTGNIGDEVEKKCIAAKLLDKLLAAGYTLYAMKNVCHPGGAPSAAQKAIRRERAPFHNVKENCEYYYKVEERFPTTEYKMGYWSDMLAVSPLASLLKDPASELGMLLKRDQVIKLT